MDYTKMDDNQILALGRAGEDVATEFLLQKYGYLVKREVRTVYLIGAETEDLAQEGMIGLFKAVRDYHPGKEASFVTFARFASCILKSSGYFNNSSSISLPKNFFQNCFAFSSFLIICNNVLLLISISTTLKVIVHKFIFEIKKGT